MSPTPTWLEHAECTAPADRVSPLIDGVEYYRAVRESLIRARHQLLVVGWDIHSEIDLLRGEAAQEAEEHDGYPVRLADLLERVLDERPELRVYMLIWEGAPLFAFERQQIPRMKRPWAARERLTLVWDRDTPPLGSQHQKIVVVDDRIAFVGGMDLTQSRWDDHVHEPDDPRRRKPGLLPTYGNPYHDIMIAVDGAAARVVGDWCRERWRRATASDLDPPNEVDAETPDAWPPSVTPLLHDRAVALAFTQPSREDEGIEEKRQVEALYLAQIASARRFVFIENQYFSSATICDALCERLCEEDGPEIVLILPYGCEKSVQAMALDTQRDVLLDRLREADPGQRLGVYWPTLRGGREDEVHDHAVYVHAKTMVVDDTLLRIGSANLANRSMGLDSELDACVWVEEGEEAGRDACEAIASYRRRLMAYLLHVSPEEVARAEERAGSPRRTIEALREGQRTLHPFEHRASTFHGLSLPIELADPARPLCAEDVVRATAIAESSKDSGGKLDHARNVAIGGLRRHARAVVLGGIIAALAAVWAFSPLRDHVDAEAVQTTIHSIRSSPFGNAGVIVGFWIMAAIGFPVTLLIATVAVVFGATTAVLISVLGVAGSASIGFAVGRWLLSGAPENQLGGRLRPIASRMRNRGVLALAVLRNVPIAPFAIVNIACGVTTLSYPGFLAGTLVGMGPGIVVASIFGQELAAWLAEPTLGGVLRLAGAVALLVTAAAGMDRLLRRRAEAAGENDRDDPAETGRTGGAARGPG